jgi:hypothetical protein
MSALMQLPVVDRKSRWQVDFCKGRMICSVALLVESLELLTFIVTYQQNQRLDGFGAILSIR